MAKTNRTAATAERTAKILKYLSEHPEALQEDLMNELRIKEQGSLYRILLGFADNPQICKDNEYNLIKDEKRLTVKELKDFLATNDNKQGISIAERMLYLYHHLYEAIPYGGITGSELLNRYTDLLSQSGTPLPKKESIRRNMLRDMERLELIGIIIQHPNSGNMKYCLDQPFLPKLSPESAAVLYVSTLLYKDTLMSNAIDVVRTKMENGLYKGMQERMRVLNERIYVVGDTLACPQEFGEVLGKLLQAICDSLPIKMTYINNDGKTTDREVEPLGLVCKRNVWYLIALQPDVNENRTFRVDQIQHVILRERQPFAYPEDFDVKEYIGSSWGVYCNDEVEKVVLKFSATVAKRVKNLRYHPSQRVVEELKDGSVIIEFEICGLIELQSWILQWGPQVEVLQPNHLRERIIQVTKDIVQLYLH